MMQGAMELCYLSYNPVSNDIRVYEPSPDGEGERLLAILQPTDEHYGIAFRALYELGTKSQFAKQARDNNRKWHEEAI
jgi:hypothetical protein